MAPHLHQNFWRMTKLRISYQHWKKGEGHIPTSKSQQVLMVTGGPIAFLEFGDSNFVNNDLDGYVYRALLDSNQTRPSELFGFSMIPLNGVTCCARSGLS